MFCRFCGKTVLDDSIFCAYCGKKLVENDMGSANFDFSTLDGAINLDNNYQTRLNKARAFAITGKYQQAMEIYTKMIDDDPTDLNGYIGCIRVASKNYVDINGYFNFKNPDNSWTYYHTSQYLEMFKKLSNGVSTSDNEFEVFLKKYNDYLAEQEKARLEQEKKRQEELEKQKREREEAEKRKPEDFKKAIQAGDTAIRENKNDEAYKSYETALRLANELKADLPNGFLENLATACVRREIEARKNNNIMNYVKALAENNNAAAQCLLGRIYYYGSYTYEYGKGEIYREEYEARRWYQMAANNNAPEALCFIGKGYYDRAKKISGYDSDRQDIERRELYLQAYYWYKKAFDQNYAPAIEKVAELHRYGFGVERNTSYALELYKKINSYYNVAMMYHYDLRNPLEAINWYKKSNNYLAIAKIYESLNRKSEAIEYYKKCVEGVQYPSDEAQKALARLLYGK